MAPKPPPTSSKKRGSSKPRSDAGKGHASGARSTAKSAKTPAKAPPLNERKSGPRMNAAEQSLRDALMIQRLAQDWPWEAIAEEAGITVGSAIKAVKKRQSSAPLTLNMDPVKTVERIARGLQLSIGDFEAVSARAALEGEWGAATSAKKAANEAREKMIGLLQATGRMPQDLSALRHLMDVREVGTKMVEIMEGFREDSEAAAGLSPARRARALERAAAEVVDGFEALMNFDRDEELALEDGEDGEEIDAEVVRA